MGSQFDSVEWDDAQKETWMLYAIMIISYVGDGFCQPVCFCGDMDDYNMEDCHLSSGL